MKLFKFAYSSFSFVLDNLIMSFIRKRRSNTAIEILPSEEENAVAAATEAAEQTDSRAAGCSKSLRSRIIDIVIRMATLISDYFFGANIQENDVMTAADMVDAPSIRDEERDEGDLGNYYSRLEENYRYLNKAIKTLECLLLGCLSILTIIFIYKVIKTEMQE
jgi:hypothetical protein